LVALLILNCPPLMVALSALAMFLIHSYSGSIPLAAFCWPPPTLRNCPAGVVLAAPTIV